MKIKIHPHARERMKERGVTNSEVQQTVKSGESFIAKFGRMGFRRNFAFGDVWRGKTYQTKQVEAYGVRENNIFIVVTVLVKYF